MTVEEQFYRFKSSEWRARDEKIKFSIFIYICNQAYLQTNIEGKSSINPPF